MNEIKPGTKLRFKEPMPEEVGIEMVCVQDRGERVLCSFPKLLGGDCLITPVQAFLKEDVEEIV